MGIFFLEFSLIPKRELKKEFSKTFQHGFQKNFPRLRSVKILNNISTSTKVSLKKSRFPDVDS